MEGVAPVFFNRFNATSRPSLLACAFVVSAGALVLRTGGNAALKAVRR